jgi:hypothetical protein
MSIQATILRPSGDFSKAGGAPEERLRRVPERRASRRPDPLTYSDFLKDLDIDIDKTRGYTEQVIADRMTDRTYDQLAAVRLAL